MITYFLNVYTSRGGKIFINNPKSYSYNTIVNRAKAWIGKGKVCEVLEQKKGYRAKVVWPSSVKFDNSFDINIRKN